MSARFQSHSERIISDAPSTNHSLLLFTHSLLRSGWPGFGNGAFSRARTIDKRFARKNVCESGSGRRSACDLREAWWEAERIHELEVAESTRREEGTYTSSPAVSHHTPILPTGVDTDSFEVTKTTSQKIDVASACGSTGASCTEDDATAEDAVQRNEHLHITPATLKTYLHLPQRPEPGYLSPRVSSGTQYNHKRHRTFGLRSAHGHACDRTSSRQVILHHLRWCGRGLGWEERQRVIVRPCGRSGILCSRPGRGFCLLLQHRLKRIVRVRR